jgi:hypothetical protein
VPNSRSTTRHPEPLDPVGPVSPWMRAFIDPECVFQNIRRTCGFIARHHTSAGTEIVNSFLLKSIYKMQFRVFIFIFSKSQQTTLYFQTNYATSSISLESLRFRRNSTLRYR